MEKVTGGLPHSPLSRASMTGDYAAVFPTATRRSGNNEGMSPVLTIHAVGGVLPSNADLV
ncbi:MULTISPECIES: hypothetical protein [unclassified Corynebacterium]|uniref:hypothetical protein n=1 Tax=unclassified Corynebacterium TaxID=2624378 RepID=UPI0029CA8C25|nr:MULTISPECIES: hypothetical protein [unclassified Corynebacterium]WPF65276.1 hypothetical protein OLX12_06710 [Corynebacterium sp. 22KM0430]WPF67771.1 hypothetical protein OLW90_06700 [Corynebacterium sp. 21KM1197]